MNILNRLQAAVLAILMLGTLTGCGGGAASGGETGSGDPVRIATKPMTHLSQDVLFRHGLGGVSRNNDRTDIRGKQSECRHQISDDDYGYHIYGIHAFADDNHFTGFT